ncbi:MAG: hypothetical protein ABSB84_01765 [Verrucomicrobiota bacterium]|jgi:hypothetical protein
MEQIIKTFCVWSDLLGFSKPFAEGSWSFENNHCRQNIVRLSKIWQVAHSASSPLDEVALFLNDGIARVHDFEPEMETPRDLLFWVDQMLRYHGTISSLDRQNSFPGVRTVLCFGERAKMGSSLIPASDYVAGSSEFQERLKQKICVYSPSEFQLNLAFSKAYFIERLGSRIGLEKSSAFYIEEAAVNVISDFLHNRCFSEWVGRDVSPDGIPSQIAPVQSRYAVTAVGSDDNLEIQIMRNTGQGAHLYYAFRYEKKPIEVDENGLKTRIHKIVGGEIPLEFVSPWSNVKIDQEARAELIKNVPLKS